MERENIIEKIKALRNLSTNPAATLEEAATAARVAEMLIQKHSLAEAEIFAASKEEVEDIINDSIPLTNWNKNQVVWHNILLTALTKAYNCQIAFKMNNGSPALYAIGRPSDIALVRYQFMYFVAELGRLANLLAPSHLRRGSGKTWHNSFYRGAVHTICEMLKKAKEETYAQASSTALVAINQHLHALSQMKNKFYPNSRVKSMGSNVDMDMNAYRLGENTASNLVPKPALENGVKGLLK